MVFSLKMQVSKRGTAMSNQPIGTLMVRFNVLTLLFCANDNQCRKSTDVRGGTGNYCVVAVAAKVFWDCSKWYCYFRSDKCRGDVGY